MAILLGRWRSPGGVRNRTQWELARKKALDAVSPSVMAQAEQVFGPEPPPISPSAAGGLDARAQRRRPFNLGRPRQFGPLDPAVVSAFAAEGDRLRVRPEPLAPFSPLAPPPPVPSPLPPASAAEELRRLGLGPAAISQRLRGQPGIGAAAPVLAPIAPAAPPAHVPGIQPGFTRAGGAAAPSSIDPRNIQQNPFQSGQGFQAMHDAQVRAFAPYSRPVGRFIAEKAVGAVYPSWVPGREAAIGKAGGIGEVVAQEIALPENLIPIPVIDPLLGKALGAGVKAGAKVTRSVLQRLSREAGEIAVREGDTALGNFARIFADDAARLVQERPLAGAATEPPRGAQPPSGEPVPSRRGPPAQQPVRRAPLIERLEGREPPGTPPPEGPTPTEAMNAKPGREAREVWRRFEGAKNTSNLRRKVWGTDRYDEAEAAGFKIVPGGAAGRQGDTVLDMMEQVWLRQAAPDASPEQRALMQSLYDRLDTITQRIVDVDPDFAEHLLPDYFPHMFKTVERPGERGLSRRGFVTRPGFKQPRKLEGPLGEILNDRPDLDLVSWDPVDIVMRHEAAADNYVGTLDAIRTLKAKGLIRPQKAAPSSWRTPDLPVFKVRAKLQGWVAEPKVAQTMEQMFGRSAFDEHGALKLIKNVRDIGFRIKVFGGFFQQIDYTFRAAGLGLSELARGRPGGAVRSWFSPLRAITRSVVPSVDRAALKAAEANPKLKLLYDNGLAAGVDPSFGDEAIRGLGRFVPQTVGGKQIPGAGVTRQVLEFMSGAGYHKFHQEMLEQSGLVILEKNLRQGMPIEEAARIAVEETNVFFSSIPAWQSAVKSATGRDALRLPFFATGELEGWFRLPFQAPAGFAGMMGATVIAAEMLNYAFTGRWLSLEQLQPYRLDLRELEQIKKEGPQALLSTGVPGVDYNTKFLRPELPWRGPDGRKVYLDLLGQADTPFRWALDPLFATQTRLGQFPRAAIDLAAISHGQAPAFGERVEGLADFGKFVLQQLSPIPLSGLAGTERGRIGFAGAGIQVGGFNVSAQPLRERLEEALQEATGQTFEDVGGYSAAVRIARTTPELQGIANAIMASRRQFNPEEQRTHDFLEDEFSRLGLGDTAQRFLAGEDVGAGFVQRYDAWRDAAAQTSAFRYFDKDLRTLDDAESDAERRYLEYVQLDPFSPQFEGEEGGVDWFSYYDARDDAFSRLPEDLQSAIERDVRLPDTEGREVETLLKQANVLRSQLREISPIRGISAEQWQELQDFWREVNDERDAARLRGREIGFEEAIRALAAFQKRDEGNPGFTEAAVIFRAGAKARDTMRNSELDLFLLRNYDALWPFYADDLYGSRRMQDLIFRARQAGLIGQEAESPAPVLETAGVR